MAFLLLLASELLLTSRSAGILPVASSLLLLASIPMLM
jgi:hypothetical protein